MQLSHSTSLYHVNEKLERRLPKQAVKPNSGQAKLYLKIKQYFKCIQTIIQVKSIFKSIKQSFKEQKERQERRVLQEHVFIGTIQKVRTGSQKTVA